MHRAARTPARTPSAARTRFAARSALAQLAQLACVACVACRAPAAPVPPAVAAPPPLVAARVPELVLPDGWAALGTAEFEAGLELWTPPGEVRDPAAPLAAGLERALASGGLAGLRAALVLARAHGPAASELLLSHLERGSADDAAPVAARAFALGATARDAARRLANLASGARAHADPRVRVECAASALFLGERSARTLLASVWNGTVNFGLDEDELAPLQERAIAALAEHAGTQPRETPWAAQRARADELARIDALARPR